MAKQHSQTCGIARFLNIFGDSWSLLIMREAFYGVTRFSEIQRNTGIAKNLLSERLAMLINEGLLEREDVGEYGSRYAYPITEKGLSLAPVIVAVTQWSNEHIFGDGSEPLLFTERKSGQALAKLAPMTKNGEELEWADIVTQVGPGANRATRARFANN